MITIKDIIGMSKKHPMGRGRMLQIENDKVCLSIVGGVKGLYGDFKEDFEVAIFDVKTGNFITNFFYPEYGDVISFLPAKKLEEMVNMFFKDNDFRVR